MKTHTYFIIFTCCMALCLSSCKSKLEKEQEAEQKMVINFLQNSLISPSSFKLVEVISTKNEKSFSYDTLLHVKTLTYHYALVDSMKLLEYECPEHTEYTIKYDAANTYGAIVRDEDEIIVYKGTPYKRTEFIDMYLANKKIVKIEPYQNKYMDPTVYVVEGEWASLDFLDIDRWAELHRLK